MSFDARRWQQARQPDYSGGRPQQRLELFGDTVTFWDRRTAVDARGDVAFRQAVVREEHNELERVRLPGGGIPPRDTLYEGGYVWRDLLGLSNQSSVPANRRGRVLGARLDGSAGLYVIDPDNGLQTRLGLASENFLFNSLDQHPDGRVIGCRLGGGNGIYWIDLATGDLERLGTDGEAYRRIKILRNGDILAVRLGVGGGVVDRIQETTGAVFRYSNRRCVDIEELADGRLMASTGVDNAVTTTDRGYGFIDKDTREFTRDDARRPRRTGMFRIRQLADGRIAVGTWIGGFGLLDLARTPASYERRGLSTYIFGAFTQLADGRLFGQKNGHVGFMPITSTVVTRRLRPASGVKDISGFGDGQLISENGDEVMFTARSTPPQYPAEYLGGNDAQRRALTTEWTHRLNLRTGVVRRVASDPQLLSEWQENDKTRGVAENPGPRDNKMVFTGLTGIDEWDAVTGARREVFRTSEIFGGDGARFVTNADGSLLDERTALLLLRWMIPQRPDTEFQTLVGLYITFITLYAAAVARVAQARTVTSPATPPPATPPPAQPPPGAGVGTGPTPGTVAPGSVGPVGGPIGGPGAGVGGGPTVAPPPAAVPAPPPAPIDPVTVAPPPAPPVTSPGQVAGRLGSAQVQRRGVDLSAPPTAETPPTAPGTVDQPYVPSGAEIDRLESFSPGDFADTFTSRLENAYSRLGRAIPDAPGPGSVAPTQQGRINQLYEAFDASGIDPVGTIETYNAVVYELGALSELSSQRLIAEAQAQIREKLIVDLPFSPLTKDVFLGAPVGTSAATASTVAPAVANTGVTTIAGPPAPVAGAAPPALSAPAPASGLTAAPTVGATTTAAANTSIGRAAVTAAGVGYPAAPAVVRAAALQNAATVQAIAFALDSGLAFPLLAAGAILFTIPPGSELDTQVLLRVDLETGEWQVVFAGIVGGHVSFDTMSDGRILFFYERANAAVAMSVDDDVVIAASGVDIIGDGRVDFVKRYYQRTMITGTGRTRWQGARRVDDGSDFRLFRFYENLSAEEIDGATGREGCIVLADGRIVRFVRNDAGQDEFAIIPPEDGFTPLVSAYNVQFSHVVPLSDGRYAAIRSTGDLGLYILNFDTGAAERVGTESLLLADMVLLSPATVPGPGARLLAAAAGGGVGFIDFDPASANYGSFTWSAADGFDVETRYHPDTGDVYADAGDDGVDDSTMRRAAEYRGARDTIYTSFIQLRDGRLLAGTLDGDLGFIDLGTGRFRRILNGAPGGFVVFYAFVELSAGNRFLPGTVLGARGGVLPALYQITVDGPNAGEIQRLPESNRLHLSLLELRDGRVLGGGDDGRVAFINPVNGEENVVPAMDSPVLDLVRDDDPADLPDTGGFIAFSVTPGVIFDYRTTHTIRNVGGKIGGLRCLPRFAIDVLPTRRAGRTVQNAEVDVAPDAVVVRGTMAVENGDPEDVNTLLRVARQGEFWMAVQNLYDPRRPLPFPLGGGAQTGLVDAYGDGAIYVSSARMRRAGPGKNLGEAGANARMEFEGLWLPGRAKAQRALG